MVHISSAESIPTHNVGKFGNRWKMLGVGGSKAIGAPTDPKRGFYHPPESIVVETKRAPLGKKEVVAKVISITAQPTHDIWAFGVVMYEAICGVPLSPYACRGKRPMSANEIARVNNWSQESLQRALRHVDPTDAKALDVLGLLLHWDPKVRANTLREVLEHPFFSGSAEDRVLKRREAARPPAGGPGRHPKTTSRDQLAKTGWSPRSGAGDLRGFLDKENSANHVPRSGRRGKKASDMSVASGKSHGSVMSSTFKGLKARMRRGQI